MEGDLYRKVVYIVLCTVISDRCQDSWAPLGLDIKLSAPCICSHDCRVHFENKRSVIFITRHARLGRLGFLVVVRNLKFPEIVPEWATVFRRKNTSHFVC